MSRLFPKVKLPDGEAHNITPNGTACDYEPEEKHDYFFSNGYYPRGKMGTKSVGSSTGSDEKPRGNRTAERAGGF